MKKLLLFAAVLVSGMIHAQDIDVVVGDFGFLAGQKEINVEFDYSKMTLLKEKKTEAQYVEDRAKDLNEKAKGNGEVWKKKWNAAKADIWNAKFLELANIIMTKEKKDVTFGEDLKSAKYTVIVEVVWIYPGYDVMVSKQPAKVSMNLKFVDSSNKSNVLLELKFEDAPGAQYGNQFNNETRIGEGFAKSGKSMSQYLIKKAFKK